MSWVSVSVAVVSVFATEAGVRAGGDLKISSNRRSGRVGSVVVVAAVAVPHY